MIPRIEATYQDGYQLIEDDADRSAFIEDANVFSDILHSRPCAKHGPLVEFALVTQVWTYRIDWTKLPESAKPIRVKRMQAQQVDGVLHEPTIVSVSFGFALDGREEVIEVR